jgi:hypothetical protein
MNKLLPVFFAFAILNAVIGSADYHVIKSAVAFKYAKDVCEKKGQQLAILDENSLAVAAKALKKDEEVWIANFKGVKGSSDYLYLKNGRVRRDKEMSGSHYVLCEAFVRRLSIPVPCGLNATKFNETQKLLNIHLRGIISQPAKGVVLKNGYAFKSIRKQTFFCIDARGDAPNFSVAGGDFAKFLLSLDIFYELLGIPRGGKEEESLTISLLKEFVDQYISQSRPFYLHSDQAKSNKVGAALGYPAPFDPYVLRNKPIEQAKFLETIKDPETQGCGHIRLIMQQPENYGIPTSLVNSLMKAYFQLYWAQPIKNSLIFYELYEEELSTGAETLIILGPEKNAWSVLAMQMVDPSKSNNTSPEETYIVNQQASLHFNRYIIAPFLIKMSTKIAPQKSIIFKDFNEYLDREEVRITNITVGTLLEGKPIYKACMH